MKDPNIHTSAVLKDLEVAHKGDLVFTDDGSAYTVRRFDRHGLMVTELGTTIFPHDGFKTRLAALKSGLNAARRRVRAAKSEVRRFTALVREEHRQHAAYTPEDPKNG
jgi:hypothetical protein